MEGQGFSKVQKGILAVLAAFFFLSASTLASAHARRPAGAAAHFDWPDETMNAFFALRFSEYGRLYEQTVSEFVRPRSFNIIRGNLDRDCLKGAYDCPTPDTANLVPGGFLGLPMLYGIAIKVVGNAAAFFLTPLLAALALLAFASVMRRAFGARAAVLAAVVAGLHPAWWYFGAYSYLPNAVFVSFLLFAAAALAAGASAVGRKRQLLLACGGLALGIALAVRTNEVLWVAAAALLAAQPFRRSFGRRSVALVLVAIALPLVAVLWQQARTFGNPFLTGYTRFADGAAAPTSFEGASTSPFGILLRAVTLPYGFHPRVIVSTLWGSWFSLAPWASVSMLVALAAWLVSEGRGGREGSAGRRGERAFFAAAAVASAWLVVSYGSWTLPDPLTLRLNTIGVSHVRYWLPLVFIGAAFLGWALARLWSWRRRMPVFVVLFLAAYGVLSFRLAFLTAAESILPVAGRVAAYDAAAVIIKEKTPPLAVILTDRTDKEIFPDRAVTPGFPSAEEGTDRAFLALACAAPLYAYAGWDDATLRARDAEIARWTGIAPQGGYFRLVAEPRPGLRLWRIETRGIKDTLCAGTD